MTVRFEDVYEDNIDEHYSVLYQLLVEREPNVNISHSTVPTWGQHIKYVDGRPHKLWFIVYNDNVPVGAMYLTNKNEIGTFTLKAHLRKGYATQATNHMKELTVGQPLYANVAPFNLASQLYCEKMGFKLMQWTYKFIR